MLKTRGASSDTGPLGLTHGKVDIIVHNTQRKIAAEPGEVVTRTIAPHEVDGPLTVNIESGTGRVELSWDEPQRLDEKS